MHRIFVILALPLLAILLVSGCTNGTIGAGKGVSVIGFEPDHFEIYSGETINFRARMRNDGYVEVRGAHAELLGLDEDWCGDKATTGCVLSSGKRLEKLPNEAECQYKGSGFNLVPVDRQAGTTGGEKICTWTYKAPLLSKGFEISYTPIIRVFYPYKSATTKLITFASSNELRRIRDSGGSLPAETIGDTEGPIQLRIETKGPIRFLEDRVVFPLEITITNLGNGAPCSTGESSEDRLKDACKGTVSGEEAKNKVTLKISLDDQTAVLDEECKALASYGKVLPLLKGQNSFVCDVQVSGLNPAAPVQKSILVEAFYEYFFDTSSSIKVIGRRSPEEI